MPEIATILVGFETTMPRAFECAVAMTQAAGGVRHRVRRWGVVWSIRRY